MTRAESVKKRMKKVKVNWIKEFVEKMMKRDSSKLKMGR